MGVAPGGLPAVRLGGSRPRWLVLWAVVSLLAGLVAGGIQLFAPFDHGVWLVAYLLLVGSLAAFLIAEGEAALGVSDRDAGSQAMLWAIGTIAVPAGVLGESRLAVVLGSAALLSALASMAAAALPPPARPATGGNALTRGYLALLVFMAISVGVGLTLAWDIAWL